MHCIFCKGSTAQSRSVEHIIPEALGNTEHFLPRGVVCDGCNNYFARKIEQPLLDSIWLRHTRARQGIVNKRGLVPPYSAIIPAARTAAHVRIQDGSISFEANVPADQTRLVQAIATGRARSLYIPMETEIDDRLLARFLAKVAMEILAQRLLPAENWHGFVIDNPQLETLRRFARVGDRPITWPYSRRRIYNENDMQLDGDREYQVLHEFTVLATPQNEIYVVVCLFGEEFAINCGGPDIEGYQHWLRDHEMKSPLYLEDLLPFPSSGRFGE